MAGVLGWAGLAAEEARVRTDGESAQRLSGADSRLGNAGEGLVDGGSSEGEQPAGLLAAGEGGAGGVVALELGSRGAGGRGDWTVGGGLAREAGGGSRGVRCLLLGGGRVVGWAGELI